MYIWSLLHNDFAKADRYMIFKNLSLLTHLLLFASVVILRGRGPSESLSGILDTKNIQKSGGCSTKEGICFLTEQVFTHITMIIVIVDTVNPRYLDFGYLE